MMPLVFSHKQTSFGPDQLHAMIEAFEAVRRELRLARVNDRATEFVALKIVDLAMTGETDQENLTVLALAAFHADQRNK
jgi:hypothetical protein